MAVAEMRKVLLIGEVTLKEKVIKELQKLSIFQSIPPAEDSPSSFFKRSKVHFDSLQENLSRLEKAINFLNQFEEKKFELGFFPSKILVKPADYSHWIKNFKWEKICQRCAEIEEEIEKAKDSILSLREEYFNLLPWKNLSFPLKKLKKARYTDYQLVIFPQEVKLSLFKLTQKQTVHAEILEESGRKLHTLLIFIREKSSQAENIIHQLRGEKVKLAENVIPPERIKQIHTQVNQLEEMRKNLQKEAKRLNREKIKLMVIYDYFYDLLREKEVHSHSQLSHYTFILKGWIKREDVPKLKSIQRKFSQIEIMVKKPGKKEKNKIPIALSNPRIFKPFELITELYGLPRYVEIDPTPFLAPFFALFLAFCLTDGGYGVLLAVLSYLVPRRVQVGEGGKKLFSLLFVSGLVTIVVGTVTGGIFGIELQQLPSFLAPLKRLALFNPMKEPMIFLVIAMAMGVIHLLTGIALELRDKLRRGDLTGAFLDQLSWLVLIIGLLLVAIPFGRAFLSGEGSGISLTFSPDQIIKLWKTFPLYSQIGGIIAAGAVITLFLFAGRKSKHIGKRLAKGAYEIYGIIQIFADILSYSRLLALGLATSVIATVVNTIAGMAGGIPILGPVALVVILILGHLGNLLINCLSGFIHTARLQFVEFFTKFYEGGGKKFEPLRREGRYTIVREEIR